MIGQSLWYGMVLNADRERGLGPFLRRFFS